MLRRFLAAFHQDIFAILVADAVEDLCGILKCGYGIIESSCLLQGQSETGQCFASALLVACFAEDLGGLLADDDGVVGPRCLPQGDPQTIQRPALGRAGRRSCGRPQQLVRR